MMEKEALTNNIADDLAARNRNWSKVDDLSMQVNTNTGELANKVDKVEGKDLSTNDYINADKQKLANIQEGANKTVISNNLNETTLGRALDATQGKVLKDEINLVSSEITSLGDSFDSHKEEFDLHKEDYNSHKEEFDLHKEDYNSHKEDYASKFPDNAGAHNSIYRGKYLGSTVTVAQYAEITAGTFKDLYIGDYWTIGGVNYRIAAFNYYRNTGDTLVPGNHLVLVPGTSLYSHIMNDTNTTTGGYTGSKMYLEGLKQAKTIINNDFSGHVVKIRAYLCNTTSGGQASAGAWADSTVDLMNEIMVYGTVVNGSAAYGLHNIGTEKSQLPLFALNPQSINIRHSYWLRDVASSASFAFVGNIGNATRSGAGDSIGVRPRFLIS